MLGWCRALAKEIRTQCVGKYANNIAAVEKAIKGACMESIEGHPSQPQTHRDHFRLYRLEVAKLQAIIK